ncbi:GAF domain-containing protein [Ruegeria sp. THAF33]|uniref:GAF domain-containing protein n=1 Tax=Ruegeria sp. THAF33 TaxID=2587853 RepID=UPI0012A9C63E|nr:GAF domain-containing protein [Ruegeria sp. THAF33]QFT71783.1 hypothetical protein FIU92_01970 [Ruegeria sp. THAF33]
MQEQRILNFANSIDSISEHAFTTFKAAVESYVLGSLGAVYFEVKIDGIRVNGKPALTSFWSSREEERDSHPLFNDGGNYSSQRAYSYTHGCPLWITTKSGKDKRLKGLDYSKVTVRSWGNGSDNGNDPPADLPAYVDYGGGDAGTSVIVPIRFGEKRSRVFGVMNIEFRDRICFTPERTQQIGTLVKAISRVIWLFETTREQSNGTARAAEDLKTKLSDPTQPGSLRTPQVFFAFGQRADPKVIEIVRAVCEKSFKNQIELYCWDKDTKTGSITAGIINKINEAAYGICYFSEPLPRGGKKTRYQDNPNVLIEAGMMHAHYGNSPEDIRRWLPIREDKERTSDLPFDFAEQRFVFVPRKGNALNADQFEAMVSASIKSLIS